MQLESGFRRILETAMRIRTKKGVLEPVGIVEYSGGEEAGLVPFDFHCDRSKLGSMVAFGQICRAKKCTRAFVVQEVLMKTMTREEREDMRNMPPPEEIPMDDRRHALFIFEINFNNPNRCAALLQEYRILGFKLPEYLEPIFQYPVPANGLFEPAVRSFRGDDCGITGIQITEESLADTSENDIDDILGDMGLQ